MIRAFVQLRTAGFLAALDLDGVDVVALAHACAEGRASDRQLRFEEVVQRHRSGEDVIGKAERGTLRSTFHQQGWRVRIEYGPVDLEQIRTLIDRAPAGATIELARPGEASWEPLKRFRASGVL